MNLLNILPLEIAQSLKDSVCVGSVIIAIISVAWLISLLLRNYEIRLELKKLKKWRKFSEIEKRQRHDEYDKLAAELADERSFSDIQSDMHVRLMLKYAAIQEDSEKAKHTMLQKETFIVELKKSFEDVVAELKKLKAENALLESCNQDNLKQIAYLKSVKNHKKRPVFEPETKKWKCVNDSDYFPHFMNGSEYACSDEIISFDKETTLLLFSENNTPSLVLKSDFAPVKT